LLWLIPFPLFNEILEYTVLVGRMAYKSWIGRDVQGSDTGLVQGTVRAFAWRGSGKPQKR